MGVLAWLIPSHQKLFKGIAIAAALSVVASAGSLDDVDSGADLALASDAGPQPDLSSAPVGLWIDGEFGDWADAPVRVTDPAGDASGPFDLVEVRATSRGRVPPSSPAAGGRWSCGPGLLADLVAQAHSVSRPF